MLNKIGLKIAHTLYRLKGSSHLTEIPIRPGTITLLQVLKLSGVADFGSDAQAMVEDGSVMVNGTKEFRKRRKLQVGDEIQIRASGLSSDLRLISKP